MLYLPLAEVFINPAALFLIGLTTGILGGCFGTAAYLLLVPSLSIFGFPTPFAVSTSILAGFGRAGIALFKTELLHYAHKRLGLALGLFGLTGVFTGHLFLAKLTEINLAAPVLTTSFIIFLGGTAATIFWRIFRHRLEFPGTWLPLPFWPFPAALSPGTPRFITFVSLNSAILIGFGMGLSAGFWGLGAGLAGVLFLVRFWSAPPAVAAATDLLAMLIIGAGALVRFALAGQVEIIAGLGLLAGIIIGNSIGSWLPARLKSPPFAFAFGCLLFFAALALLFKHLGQGETAGLALLWGAVLLCTGLVLASFLKNFLARLKTSKVRKRNSSSPAFKKN